MNTFKSLALGLAIAAGSAFAGTSVDLTANRHVNVDRFNDQHLADGDRVGLKLTIDKASAKVDGLASDLRWYSPCLTLGYAVPVLGMDRINVSLDRHVVGLGLDKTVPVNSAMDMQLGAGLLRDSDSNLSDIPQVTANIGLSIHIW